MRYTVYEPGAAVIPLGTDATRLIVVTRGKCDVSIELVSTREESSDLSLSVGDFVGEFAILGDRKWGASMAIGIEDSDVEMTACTYNFVVSYIRHV